MLTKNTFFLAIGAALAFSGPAAMAEYTKNGSVASAVAPSSTPMKTVGTAAIPIALSSARLAVYIKPGFIVRAKNVQAVFNPSTGIYCVQPTTASGLTATTITQIVPTTTVEWGQSLITVSDAMFAYYEASASSCPSGTIKVMTFDGNPGGAPFLTNGIAFTLEVPYTLTATIQ